MHECAIRRAAGMGGEINLVVAHPLEAKALLGWFGLERFERGAALRRYDNNKGIALVIAGMGAENAAAGVRFLHQRRPAAAWLNIGVAGHGSAKLGEGLLIDRIENRSGGERYWPAVPRLKPPGSSLITVPEPETGYAENAAYDMEAAGFFAAASRLAPAELVQVFKIVSDNPENPLADLNLKQIPDLVGGQEAAIRRLVDRLRERSARFGDWHSLPPEFETLLGKYRFSATRKAAFKRICRRFRALGKQQRLTELAQSRYRDAATLMAALESELKQFDPAFPLQAPVSRN